MDTNSTKKNCKKSGCNLTFDRPRWIDTCYIYRLWLNLLNDNLWLSLLGWGVIGAIIGGGSGLSSGTTAETTIVTTTQSSSESISGSSETQTTSITETTPAETTPAVPSEYLAALASAKSYSENMHMSKQGIYDQLTSDYGEKFTQEEADYAMANIDK